MARSKDVLLRFLVDDKQKSKLAGIGNEAGRTQSKFSQLSGGAKALVGGFAAIVGTKIVQFLGDAAQAAAEDQKAQELLKLALQNSTGATDEQVASTEEWIDKTARATGVADDQLRPALAELARTTGSLDQAQNDLNVAMDIAAAKGVSLETVTRAMGKAALGNVGALGRLGVATKDAAGETLTYEEVLAEASRTMGGAAATAAGTMAGQLAIAKVKIDEAKESLGAALIPTIGDLAGVAGDAATTLGFLSEKMAALGLATGGAGEESDGLYLSFLKLAPITGDLLKLNEGLADWIETTAEEAEDAASGGIADLSEGMDRARHKTRGATDALQDFESEVRSQIDPIFNLVEKINALDEAQANTATTLLEYGKGSAQHREALRKEAQAWLAVKDAQIRAAQEAGLTREAFRKVLQDMRIFTDAEMDLIIEDFDRVDNFQFRDKVINVRVKGGTLIGDDRSGARASGGPVHKGQSYLVGERGPELVTMGGNGHVTPNSALGGGGFTYALTVNAGIGADGGKIGKAIVEEIRQYEKRNGRSWRS